MHLFIKASKKLDPNQQMYTIPRTVILQLQNNKAWKVLWCFQHGLVILLVRLWQLWLMVSPTGGADIPGTLLHPAALPTPGHILPENWGVQITLASRERGLFSTFLCSGFENTCTMQPCSLAAFLVTCKMFLPILAYSWFFNGCPAFFQRMGDNFHFLVEFQIFLSPSLSCYCHFI